MKGEKNILILHVDNCHRSHREKKTHTRIHTVEIKWKRVIKIHERKKINRPIESERKEEGKKANVLFLFGTKEKETNRQKEKKNKQTVLWCNFCFSQPNRKKNINARRRECESARGSVRRVKHTNGIESFYYFDQSRFDTHLLFAPAGYKLNLSCIRYSHFHFQLTIIWNQAHEERESIHLKSICENNLLAWYEFWFHIFLSTLNVWYNLINKYFCFFPSSFVNFIWSMCD